MNKINVPKASEMKSRHSLEQEAHVEKIYTDQTNKHEHNMNKKLKLASKQ